MFDYLQSWKDKAPDVALGINSVGQLLSLTVNIVLGSALAITFIGIITSGIKFTMAGGDPKAKSTAQQSLTYSMAGLVLAIAAFGIKTILFNVLGGDFRDLQNATPNF